MKKYCQRPCLMNMRHGKYEGFMIGYYDLSSGDFHIFRIIGLKFETEKTEIEGSECEVIDYVTLKWDGTPSLLKTKNTICFPL